MNRTSIIHRPQWQEIRDPRTGRLLFKYDADCHVVEIQQRRQKVWVDLTKLKK